MKKLKKNNWSAEEWIAMEFNFQNLETIKKIFNILINKDFLEEIKKRKIIRNDEEVFLEKNFEEDLKKILNLRHSLVHDLPIKIKINYSEISQMCYKIHVFADIVYEFLD